MHKRDIIDAIASIILSKQINSYVPYLPTVIVNERKSIIRCYKVKSVVDSLSSTCFSYFVHQHLSEISENVSKEF